MFRLLILVWLGYLSSASKILLIPNPYKSHVNFFSVTGEGLTNAGHEVHILLLETARGLADKHNIHVIPYPPAEGAGAIQSEDATQEMLELLSKKVNMRKVMRDMADAMLRLCESIHENGNLMTALENLDLDLVLVDGFDLVRCFYSIPYRLGVRYMTLSARHDPWNAGIPSLPSVEPVMGLGHHLSVESSFYEIMVNLLKGIMSVLVFGSALPDDSMITKYCPTRPAKTFHELFQNSEMFLINLETVCLDHPRVYANHYQFVAGMGLEVAKPLSPDLEDFVTGSRVGFIVLSFGSGLKNIPEDLLEKMLNAFSQVEHRIVMRHNGDIPDKIPANVKIMSWLPQGDLLGHPKARAFITHGGGNGQLEALHHAVPVITIPMFGDQFYNAERAVRKGFGVTLDKNTFTSEELVDAINKVSKDKPFRENIRQCSERFHSLPAAQDTIAFWVEHIIRFGGDHLKPLAIEVPLWKMFMLDIIALIIVVILVLYTVLLYICCKIRGKFRGTERKTTKTE